MTYARFLLLFVALPAALLAIRFRRDLGRRALRPFGLLLLVVYAATSPWDNAAVANGLWGFDEARIWGIRLFHLPLEEYLFFGLQTLLTGAWVWHRLCRAVPEPASGPRPTRARPRDIRAEEGAA